MDPLSVSASIIAVATALYSVSRKLRSCAKTIAHAAREIIALAKEMDACSTLFRCLKSTIEQLTAVLPQGSEILKVCDNLVSQALENVDEFKLFLKGLEPLSHSRSANSFDRMIARLKWVFQRTDLLLLRSKLDSSKTTINMSLIIINLKGVAQQLTAAEQKSERDRTEIKDLRHQMKVLKLQLRDERSTVRAAVTASRRIEYHVRRQVPSPHSLTVARQALHLAKTLLEQYDRQTYQSLDRQPEPRLNSSGSSSATSEDSSPPPGPPGPPSPPPSPPQPLVSTRDADRKRSTIAVNSTPSRAMSLDEPGPSWITRVDPSGQGTQPTATDINIDMGYRTARTLDQWQERGSRARDAGRNVM